MATHFFLLSVVVVLSLAFLVAVVEPSRSYGSKGVTTSLAKIDNGAQPSDGLCALGIIVHGYKCQEFKVRHENKIQVTTEDGYILSMQRIPEGRGGGGGGSNKQPVLVQHGVLVDGMSWLLNAPDQSLPFILADRGFDVWIANGRGTRFSRGHKILNPTKSEYWNWSWDELVAYDFSATLEFVYSQTGQKIDYVGHSMGSLVALASLSQGYMVEKLKAVALLCPVAYLSHMRTGISVLVAHSFFTDVIKSMGISEFNPRDPMIVKVLNTICANPGMNCYDLFTFFTGKNCCLNASTTNIFLENEPQPTSTKNAVHFAQTVREGVFSKFDYGSATLNMEHYGQNKPPIYNLTNIPKHFPLFISYGGQDALADVDDVSSLLDSLKLHDVGRLTVQFVKDYAHADFIMGVTAKDIVYKPLISFLKQW